MCGTLNFTPDKINKMRDALRLKESLTQQFEQDKEHLTANRHALFRVTEPILAKHEIALTSHGSVYTSKTSINYKIKSWKKN
jgi:hypothetical protein